MEKREQQFVRNTDLEQLLHEVNSNMYIVEENLLKENYEEYPVIFVMGPLRSGTTLMTQWLANTGEFAYPSNMLSRFFQAPIMGAKIQQLLTNPKYNFRNEILDFSTKIDYSSQNGKTKGALAPNEFWYFWRRFFKYPDKDVEYISDAELEKTFDKKTFCNEINGMANVFGKPFVLKGMIANYNIEYLNKIISKALFISIKRDIHTNVASVLEARKRQLGSEKEWYSFRIPEIHSLLEIENPVAQAAGQVYYIQKEIERALKSVSENRKLVVEYEEFCKEPEAVYHEIRKKLLSQRYEISASYSGEKSFSVTKKDTEERIKKGCDEFFLLHEHEI